MRGGAKRLSVLRTTSNITLQRYFRGSSSTPLVWHFSHSEILLPRVRLIKTQKVVETCKNQEGKNSISEVLETCTKSERAHQSYVSRRTSRERGLSDVSNCLTVTQGNSSYADFVSYHVGWIGLFDDEAISNSSVFLQATLYWYSQN